MIVTIFASLVPLVFKESTHAMVVVDIVTTVIFIADYIMRWITADMKLEKGAVSFIRYPFTGMAIVDLLSILPSLMLLNPALKVLKVFRLIRALRVLKIFKGFRYSKNIAIIAKVFKNQKKSLITVGVLAVGYILVSALVVFNVEPETFPSFFDAVYWSTISLTTVGYGDIYTTTVVGRMITMLSSLFGVAIVALPAGIITAGYMNEINEKDDSEKEEK
jgi:voltage-gated potassium channel